MITESDFFSNNKVYNMLKFSAIEFDLPLHTTDNELLKYHISTLSPILVNKCWIQNAEQKVVQIFYSRHISNMSVIFKKDLKQM